MNSDTLSNLLAKLNGLIICIGWPDLHFIKISSCHGLRTSGFLKLPLERTLRDYVHYFTHRPGSQSEQLLCESKIEFLPENRLVSLILAEMKIKEGLVYNKYLGEMIGFTD